jgi:hypothetical protein
MTQKVSLLKTKTFAAVLGIAVMLAGAGKIKAQSSIPQQPAGQDASDLQAPTPTNSTDTTAVQGSQPVAPKNDRLFDVLPNYTTVESEDKFGPLSAGAKFKLATDSAIDPVTFPFIGFVALLGQAENSEPSYGQGLKGYAKRYGTSYGDAIIGTYMTVGIYPAVLKQDPRYFQLGQGSVTHRTLYSVSRIFWTRTDSGGHNFNYSEIVGNLTAAGMSNIYHPAEDRTLSNTLSVWGTDVMWDTVSNVAKEFWPDIHRKLHKQND